MSNLKLYESIKQINDTDYEAKIQTLKTNNSEYFDSNGNKLSHLKKIESAYKMVKCILSESRKDKDYIHLKMALDFYDIYSKYEHTGKYTEKIIAWAYNKDSQHIINELITFPNIIIMDYLVLHRKLQSDR